MRLQTDEQGTGFLIMNGREQGRAALADSMHRLPWALGYSLTSMWATVLLFSAAFSSAPSSALVTISMLSGVVACLGALFLHSKGSLFNGRCGTSSLYATGMAVGTLLCTFPTLAGVGPVHDTGLVLSGFFAILLLLTWFEAFSALGRAPSLCWEDARFCSPPWVSSEYFRCPWRRRASRCRHCRSSRSRCFPSPPKPAARRKTARQR